MLASLRLINFRCFEQLSLELPEGGAIFVGDNAQGKTSVLEAICLLVRLGSPRVKKMRSMIQVDQPSFGVAGECWGRDQQVRYSRKGLEMKVEQEEMKKQSEYLANSGLVVWMGNEDLDLVRGGSECRRRYLDFLASQVDAGYRRALGRYKKCVKMRNVLLKAQDLQEDELRAYAEVMIEAGAYVTKVRQKLVSQLEPLIGHAQQAVSHQPEQISMSYQSGVGDDFRAALEASRERERRQRQTVVGPHRDDLVLSINGLDAAEYASEGQQRTLALAMKLAQGEALRELGNQMPIYLLDDIFGELDPTRRNALIDYLPDRAQKLITTTNIDWMNSNWKGLQRFIVEAGTVSAQAAD